MAMTAGTRGPGGAFSSINVTPMADIMIVLLIIFMLATSAFTRESARALPFAKSAEEQHASKSGVTIVVTAQAATLDDLSFLRADDMLPLLETRFESAPSGGRSALVRAERGVPYGAVEAVLVVCRQAGAEPIALVTAPWGDPGDSAF